MVALGLKGAPLLQQGARPITLRSLLEVYLYGCLFGKPVALDGFKKMLPQAEGITAVALPLLKR